MPPRPDALVVGPMKAGTTWLHDTLAALDQVCLPHGIKETHYFDQYFHRGLTWYESHFRHFDPSRHHRILEIAPSYFHCPDSPQRIRQQLGDIPLVFTLRNPVKRAWSHYLHLRRYGYTQAPLQQAVKQFPQLLTASRYAAGLRTWQPHFSEPNLHVLWQEDLARNPESYARRFHHLLELPWERLPEISLQPSNQMAVPPSTHLAAIGRIASHGLRRCGLYRWVNWAKNCGMKRLFFGTPGKKPTPQLSQEDAAWLTDQLSDDLQNLPEPWRHPAVPPILDHPPNTEPTGGA